MKHRIRKTLSLVLALIMLLSMVPLVYAAEDADEFAGLETLEEIPFEFVLEPGDLPYELLREAVLDVRDIPACIDHALAEERGHVNRLYLQEPDDCTVMFQNRDGSKTIYLFSHPVKGMTASTVATVQINGTSVSFSGDNAITSRLAEITNFNIGSAEIAYLPVGVLSENGVNITEDVRSWTLAESIDVVQAYNISSEAAAEYAASVAVPETDAAATAAAAPGITITPNDPAPLGGMTVMSISYSDLAGVMSFKSVSANKHLTLHPNNLASLMMYSGILNPYSRWVVSYDSYFGYTLTNLYHPESKYIGFDEDGDFAIAPIDDMIEAFRVDIVSSSNNSVNVTISYGGFAIDSTASLYLNDPDATSYPTSCQWTIYTKTDYEPVQSITTSRIRTVNAEEPFYAEYTTNPAEPTYSDIKLHYASNNQVVPTDSDFDMDDLCAYVIAEPGMYQVYYKDSSTGVRSANFWLNVVQNVRKITPASSVRIEQSGVGFYLDYTVLPELANNYSISLYYASNDEEVDYEEDEDGEPDYYYIDTPGIYTVYYKDSVSGVSSENFTLIIVESLTTYAPKNTYSITPASMPIGPNCLYLTMDTTDGLVLRAKIPNTNVKIDRGDGANHYITCERLADVSRTFTFKYADDSQNMEDGVYISATMSTSQYGTTPGSTNIDAGIKYTGSYSVLDSDTMPNTIVYADDSVDLIAKASGSLFKVCNMGSYYLIIYDITVSNDTSIVRALKINDANNDVEIAIYDGSDAFKWRIERVGVDAPAIKQVYKYWCGPTSFLQVLYGMGVDTAVGGNNLSEQQTTISNAWGRGQAAVYTAHYKENINGSKSEGTKLVAGVRWLPEEYTCNEIESPTEQQLRTNIRSSLDSGAACIIFTVSGGNGHEYSPYKYSYKVDEKGVAYAHYVCVIGYDEVSDTVILNNCHYSNYRFGIYEVDFSDFCEDVGRLLYFEKTSSQQGGS